MMKPGGWQGGGVGRIHFIRGTATASSAVGCSFRQPEWPSGVGRGRHSTGGGGCTARTTSGCGLGRGFGGGRVSIFDAATAALLEGGIP
jgi:hypothetical protein